MPEDLHRAQVDPDGTIHISSDSSRVRRAPAEDWKETPAKPVDVWQQVREQTGALLSEGASQYQFSFRQLFDRIRFAKFSLKKAPAKTWEFLSQPVWVPRKNKAPKQYSRAVLFCLDVVRFGGTFAALFVALFVSLNYQSFWQIASPYLSPVKHAQSQNSLTNSVDQALKDNLLKSPALATAGAKKGDMLSFLPEVGPPNNWIIIPKLALNVPLVTPSYQALLSQEWDKLEEDIQAALEMGVVHYPGTAKPGQAGNFFVTGHSSYYPWAQGNYKTIFARLHELEVGDEYWVYYGGDKHRYRVMGKKEVRPSNVAVLDQPIDKRVSTLMTCTPTGTTLRRLILTAEEIDPFTGVTLAVGEKGTRDTEVAKPQMLPI